MAHYELNREEIAELDLPVKGKGGFQSLIRRLQTQVNHATGEIKLSGKDIEDIQKQALDYKEGTFEDRLLRIFGRVLGPKLGREE